MVKLRRFNKNDTLSYLQIANDERSYLPFGFCKSLEDAQFVIDFYMSTDVNVNAYAITNDDILIGAICAETVAKGSVELSYFVGKNFQRKGFMTEALKILQEILKEQLKIHKIGFTIDKNNFASMKTALKFGAKLHTSGPMFDYYEKVII